MNHLVKNQDFYVLYFDLKRLNILMKVLLVLLV